MRLKRIRSRPARSPRKAWPTASGSFSSMKGLLKSKGPQSRGPFSQCRLIFVARTISNLRGSFSTRAPGKPVAPRRIGLSDLSDGVMTPGESQPDALLHTLTPFRSDLDRLRPWLHKFPRGGACARHARCCALGCGEEGIRMPRLAGARRLHEKGE